MEAGAGGKGRQRREGEGTGGETALSLNPLTTAFIHFTQAAAEAKRTDELRKQLAEEREKEEFEVLAAGAGGKRV